MASGRDIKGITVEIGGDTMGLQKALSAVNGSIKSTQAQLKDVNNLLKLDPSNTVLVAQKQELLKDAISDTAKKLETLEAAQNDVRAAMESGDIGREQYMAFQREVEETRATLSRYQNELSGLDAEQDRLAKNTDRLTKLFQATGTNVDDYADVLGNRLVSAIKDGSATSDQLKAAIEKVASAATGSRTDINQLAQALDALDDGEAINNLIRELREAGQNADDTDEQLEDMGRTLTGGVLMEAADQLSAVSDKITELGQKAMEAFNDTTDASAKAAAYFGETGDTAKQTADIIQKVYGEGVGDSMDAVSDAVIAVKKNLKDLSEADMTNLTEQAIRLDELYGIDMNETLRGVNSLMGQFGMSAQEAMDYIVKGTQNGLDKTNELGDNLAEYSGKFAQAGYSANEYFQLLQNGLEGGAYNLDKVNDAINEVTTRIVDGTIGDAIGDFSEQTQAVFKAWQEGGATQKDVINSIVADIAGCTNQQQQLNLAATAFGTMAEDGNAKFITSLTSVGNTYDSVAGSAQNMFDQTTTPMMEMEANTRQLEQSLIPLGQTLSEIALKYLPPLIKAVQEVIIFFQGLPEPVQNFILILGGLTVAFTALAPTITAVAVAVTALEVPLLPIIGIIAGVAAAIALIITAVQNWGAITEWFGGVWQNITSVCSELWNNICQFFTETIPNAWNSLVQIFEGIPAWWSGVWQQVKDFFVNTWNSILENPIVKTIVDTIQKLWENAANMLSGIWNGIQQTAMGIWELIKNVILAPVLLLIDLVTGNFDKLKQDAERIWNNISQAASNIWNGITGAIVSLVSGLVEGVIIKFNGFRDAVGQIWNGILSTASNIWNNIKQFVVNTALNLKDSAVNAFNSLVSGAAGALKNLTKAVMDGFAGAIKFITDLPGQALKWGIDFVQGIIKGIQSMVGAVGDAVSDVANKIRSFLHFSVPDEGPLTDYESWMPDFMKGLAKGIEKSKRLVTNAIAGVSEEMRVNAIVDAVGSAQTAQAGGVNEILTMLHQYLPYLQAEHNVYMDKNAVVGVIAPDVNKALNNISLREGRM